MGIPKLWPLLQPAATASGLLQLAEDSFTSSPHRAYRLGVDASLWLFHVRDLDKNEDAGANPALRTLFFKTVYLLTRNVHPLFMFDGPEKPKWKRGHMVGGGTGLNEEEKAFAELLGLLGCQWRQARGEAEAELAAYAMRGDIDAVMTDDVDTLAFGAPLIIRNPSSSLSGASSSSSQASAKHNVTVYDAKVLKESLGYDRSGMILIALLSGGDYQPEGLPGCGAQISSALALLGFGSSLTEGYKRYVKDGRDLSLFEKFLTVWRDGVVVELQTNEGKRLTRREPALARKLASMPNFPGVKVLEAYLHPKVTDCSMVKKIMWEKEVDVRGLVEFFSSMFEWSCEEITAKFRNLLWRPFLIREIRLAALNRDSSLPRSLFLYPDSDTALFEAVHDIKTADSTEGVESYRVELNPDYFLPTLVSYLPDPDPHPIPDLPSNNDDSDDDAISLPLSRNPSATSSSSTQLSPVKPRRKPKEPVGRTAHSHWIPVKMLRTHAKGLRAIEKWEEKERRKKEEKEEKAETKARRQTERELKKREKEKKETERSLSSKTKTKVSKGQPQLSSLFTSTKSSTAAAASQVKPLKERQRSTSTVPDHDLTDDNSSALSPDDFPSSPSPVPAEMFPWNTLPPIPTSSHTNTSECHAGTSSSFLSGLSSSQPTFSSNRAKVTSGSSKALVVPNSRPFSRTHSAPSKLEQVMEGDLDIDAYLEASDDDLPPIPLWKGNDKGKGRARSTSASVGDTPPPLSKSSSSRRTRKGVSSGDSTSEEEIERRNRVTKVPRATKLHDSSTKPRWPAVRNDSATPVVVLDSDTEEDDEFEGRGRGGDGMIATGVSDAGSSALKRKVKPTETIVLSDSD
ncbi:hypothetical protein T439DRAFT_381480 [Meredithblackwellia eburnea MCA 4105]